MTLKGIKKMDDKELEELQRFISFGLRLVRGVEWEVEQRQKRQYQQIENGLEAK